MKEDREGFLQPHIDPKTCIGCHKCYYDSCIKMYCPYCQMKFYSHLIEKNKDNLYPATWKKYHCDEYLNNEQMTCIRCEEKLWVK